jgi:uncharacterized membrane protein
VEHYAGSFTARMCLEAFTATMFEVQVFRVVIPGSVVVVAPWSSERSKYSKVTTLRKLSSRAEQVE